jgi:hypothetical protein
VKEGHSNNAAGRSGMSEGIGKGGGIMNEKEFCFFCQCIFVSKQMFMLKECLKLTGKL